MIRSAVAGEIWEAGAALRARVAFSSVRQEPDGAAEGKDDANQEREGVRSHMQNLRTPRPTNSNVPFPFLARVPRL
jgi:hypothetical protein